MRLKTPFCFWLAAGALQGRLAVASEQDLVDGPVIGVDLGTTFACMGIWKNAGVEIVPNGLGNRITPTYVAYTADGRLIGEAAKNQAVENPSQTLYNAKRFIGRRSSDTDVQRDLQFVPFAVVDNQGYAAFSVKIKGEDSVVTPQEISAAVLSSLKTSAEEYLGQEVQHAVITVPAHFTDTQRQATKDAGAIAGLNVLKVLNEPTAAAIAFGLDKAMEKRVLVFDLGGGTLDVSVLSIYHGTFEVEATSGDAHLGGEDFDLKVVEYVQKVIQKKHNIDLSGNHQALQKLRVEVEKVKRRLSQTHQARLFIEALLPGFDLAEQISRARFEELNADLFQRTLVPLKHVLEDAKLSKDQIDEIVMVGGSSRIPKVQKLVEEFFGKAPSRGVNPDEAVAQGAAAQAGLLSSSGQAPEAVLVDVLPLSLGIETAGGVMTSVLARNTALPAKNSTVFSTLRDNQPGIRFKVFEGERRMTRNNNLLGIFSVLDLAPAARGKPQVEVTFEVDASGMLNVRAEDKGTGQSAELVVKGDEGRLSKAQIEQMIKDAEEFAEEDEKARLKADATSTLKAYLHSMQLEAEGHGVAGFFRDELSTEDKTDVMGAVNEVRDWLDANPDADPEEVREQRSAMETICGQIAAKYGVSSGGEDEDNDGVDEGSANDEL